MSINTPCAATQDKTSEAKEARAFSTETKTTDWPSSEEICETMSCSVTMFCML